MIFYTLQGPKYRLEIHDDKIKLIRKGFWGLFSNGQSHMEWRLDELAQFQISAPKFIWGKLEWSTFDGTKNSFKFTTNAAMVAKIERYMHKLVLKNYQKRQGALPLKRKEHPKEELQIAA